MKTAKITLFLDQLNWKGATSSKERSRPYLWNIFFKVDGSCVRITETFKLEGKAEIRFTPGSHGNLGVSGFTTGDTAKVPHAVGTWSTELTPFTLPYFESKVSGAVGLISILMEQNNVSLEGAEAGHHALNEMVKTVINQLILDFDPKIIDIKNVEQSIFGYFDKQISKYVRQVESVVSEAVKSKQSFLQNIWSLVSRDNLIGYHVWKFGYEDLVAHNGNLHFLKQYQDEKIGTWELTGGLISEDFQA